MDCHSFRTEIDAYADGALDPIAQAAYEAHSAACAECRRAVTQARRMGDLLRAELPRLAAATPAEQVSLRENVLRELGIPADRQMAPAGIRPRIGHLRRIGLALGALLLVLVALALPLGEERTVSAAEIVERAHVAAEQHQGMSGVLHWEAEWSQRHPSSDQITRTFEIWFSFENPGQYRLTQRGPDGRVSSEVVRDGVDRVWQLSRVTSEAGREQISVDEIILSPQDMRALSSRNAPSPFLDDLDRFQDVLSTVEKVGVVEVAGRKAYIVRGQLFGFGQPGAGDQLHPITSTVQLVVDADTYWVLGRIERVPQAGQWDEIPAGVSQRTRRFEILSPEQIPRAVFDFTPPPEANVRTLQGIDALYLPISGAISLEEAVDRSRFTLVVPSELPDDFQSNPHVHLQGRDRAGALEIMYVGRPGRRAFLVEYEHLPPLGQAARAVSVGNTRGWLVPDSVDADQFSLHLIDAQPSLDSDGRPWPAEVELQAQGMSLDEAMAMLTTLQPYSGKGSND